MAKNWYPVIDYSKCIECGLCVRKCSHNVYDKAKEPSPVVVKPNDCVDHCHGCGNRCPVGAITYVGDDTGWIPPNCEKTEENDCGCGCGCDCEDCSVEKTSTVAEKRVTVEYLYLDIDTCDRCIGTDDELDVAMSTLLPALKTAGFEVSYRKIQMETAEMAIQYKFFSSPTIRVNGNDICTSVSESSCGCCSNISGTDVDCRVFEYDGKTYEVPPKAMLADAILKAVFSKSRECICNSYELPENLKRFYDGKRNKSLKCSCSGGSCCG